MREKSRYKLPGPDCVAYVFVFVGSIIVCRFDTLTLTDQTQFTLRQTVFSICRKYFWPFRLAAGPKKTFFTGPDPALESPLRI